jgi:hypothetical protein
MEQGDTGAAHADDQEVGLCGIPPKGSNPHEANCLFRCQGDSLEELQGCAGLPSAGQCRKAAEKLHAYPQEDEDDQQHQHGA